MALPIPAQRDRINESRFQPLTADARAVAWRLALLALLAAALFSAQGCLIAAAAGAGAGAGYIAGNEAAKN